MVDLWTILPAISLGTFLTGVLTFLGNKWFKSREEEVEMSKLKMDAVVLNLPIYGLLAAIFSGLYYESIKRRDGQNQDKRLLFCYICDILRLDRIIYYDKGGLVLNDLDAESIISAFEYVLYSTLLKKFDKEALSKMRELMEDTEFHKFCEKITKGEGKELYDKFAEWYTSLKEEDLTNLENKSKCIDELLFFELNTIFSRWYKRKPHFNDLSEELQKYLLETHERDPALTNEPKKQEVIKRYYKKISK